MNQTVICALLLCANAYPEITAVSVTEAEIPANALAVQEVASKDLSKSTAISVVVNASGGNDEMMLTILALGLVLWYMGRSHSDTCPPVH